MKEIRRALKGGKSHPKLALLIMLYSYCSIFHINPLEAEKTPMSLMIKMLTIHGEVKRIEAEELSKGVK